MPQTKRTVYLIDGDSTVRESVAYVEPVLPRESEDACVERLRRTYREAHGVTRLRVVVEEIHTGRRVAYVTTFPVDTNA